LKVQENATSPATFRKVPAAFLKVEAWFRVSRNITRLGAFFRWNPVSR
jgi:hypothetical protein